MPRGAVRNLLRERSLAQTHVELFKRREQFRMLLSPAAHDVGKKEELVRYKNIVTTSDVKTKTRESILQALRVTVGPDNSN